MIDRLDAWEPRGSIFTWRKRALDYSVDHGVLEPCILYLLSENEGIDKSIQLGAAVRLRRARVAA